MPGMFHNRLRYQRHVLDIAHPAHRSSPTRWSMHAARIQLDHAFFVRQAAQTNAAVIRIVFRPTHHTQGRI